MATWQIPGLAPRPLLVVVAGPSGAGKSSVLHAFLDEHDDFVASVSATTRPPRTGEKNGVHYYFLSPEEFIRRREAGAFLECAEVFGNNWYGTPRSFIDAQFAAGNSVIMDIDVQGAAQIRANMPESVQVFLVPPNVATLESRLRGRGTEEEATIQRRLDEAKVECARANEFSYLVVNHTIKQASDDLHSIVQAEGLRTLSDG